MLHGYNILLKTELSQTVVLEGHLQVQEALDLMGECRGAEDVLPMMRAWYYHRSHRDWKVGGSVSSFILQIEYSQAVEQIEKTHI